MNRATTRMLLVTMGMSVCAAAPALHAQRTLDINDREFASATIVVMAFDIFAAKCAAAAPASAGARDSVATWLRANDVALIRARIEELNREPEQRDGLTKARDALNRQFGSVNSKMACVGAVSVTTQAEAQFATATPDMLRALRERSGTSSRTAGARNGTMASMPPGAAAVPGAPTVGTRGGVGTSAPPTERSARTAATLSRIESFGFDTRTEMGMGGFIGLKIFPVVLFRDGTALTDVAALGAPEGIDTHQRATPRDWTRWRRAGGEIQLLDDGKWDKLAFQRTYSAMPNGFRLNGRFRRTGGTGNIAIGGSESVIVTNEYTFTPDGRVLRGGSAGATAAGGNVAVTTQSVAPDRRGQYSIDGLTLRIRYDDGTEERRILVTDPSDPKSAIWLDGDSYVRR
jgi:hypothetical protein